MGVSAVNSHADGGKHERNLAKTQNASRVNISDFFGGPATARQNSVEVNQPASSTSSEPSGSESDTSSVRSDRSTSRTVTNFVTKNDTLKAEILWVLKMMKSHYSYKSSEDMSELFRRMFPDSEIAKQFSCAERKSAYLCCFGLAPHFKKMLEKSVKEQDCFVLLFDESLNHKTKNKQMDVHIRIWEGDHVITRYFGSVFMGHATANDMVKHFHEATTQLNLNNLCQLSMDGPNVNWKFYDIIQEELKDNYGTHLLNAGSCGLHIIHGAFKDGSLASDWKLKNLFFSLYRLFKDTPARREDYEKITGSSVFAQKFCNHRWLENVPVAERALKIWPFIQEYVQSVNNKKVPNPGTTSFDVVKAACGDHFLVAKIHFFISVAKQVLPFLTLYQTDKPMIPFLCDDLHRMLRGLLQRFVKGEVLKEANSVQKLLKIDIHDSSVYMPYQKIDIGFATESELKQLNAMKTNKKISDKQFLEFRVDCRNFLFKTVTKLMDKAPIKYSLVRHLSCLDPRNLADNRDESVANMRKLLKLMSDSHRIPGGMSKCDDVLREFVEFIDTVVPAHLSTFQGFDPHCKESRVDSLFHGYLANKPGFRNLWDLLFKKVLLLSHGQASVERGFSVNKQIEVENLLEESVVAQRVIHDHIASVGGINNVELSKELLVSAASARQRYMAHLDEQRSKKLKEQGCKKRKCLLDEVDEFKAKRRRIEKDIDSLTSSADDFAEKAEATGKLTFITKSNSMRRTVKDKKQELNDINNKLDEKLQALKDL